MFKLKTFFLCLLITFCLSSSSFVLALEANYPPIFGLTIGSGTFPEYAKYFFNIGIGLAGFLAVCVIAYGAVYYMISIGIGKITDIAKKTRGWNEGLEWVKAGILGLFLTLSAYVIAYTINPDLVVFKLDKLIPIISDILPGQNIQSGPPTEFYQTINIGGAIEQAIAFPMHCYEYDALGNPIGKEYQYKNPNYTLSGPMLLDHDPFDCFLKISDALGAKAATIKSLAEKINDLMAQCKCETSTSGYCEGDWKKDKCSFSQEVSSQEACIGAKAGAKICGDTANCKCDKNKKKPKNPLVSTKSPFSETVCDVCPDRVRDKIEIGPIKVIPDGENQSCDQLAKEYKGLAEFRKLNDIKSVADDIIAKVECFPGSFSPPDEVSVRVDEAYMASANPIIITDKDKQDCQNALKQLANSGDKDAKERLKTGVKKWEELALTEQFLYLKEKMNQFLHGNKDVPGLQQRLDSLKTAEDSLAKCYLATSYVDFVKIVEQTKKEEKNIVPQNSFGRYCKEFAYANSECYNFCNQECPITNFECFTGCPDCSGYKDGISQKTKCLKEADNCVSNCWKSQKCLNGAKYINFGVCMESCKFVDSSPDVNAKGKECAELCKKNNPTCSEQYLICARDCQNDSACFSQYSKDVFGNSSVNYFKCIINSQQSSQVKKCFQTYKSKEYINPCAKTLFTCENCSMQNAGYPDCVNTSSALRGQYSSLDISENPDIQICKSCYQGEKKIDPKTGKTTQETTPCFEKNPETAKCPSCSECSDCPCLTCGVDCQKYGYNDDPLVFYCRQDWWNQPDAKDNTPKGKTRKCVSEREIPVGQTIDDTEKWISDFIKAGDEIIKKSDDLISYIKTMIDDKQVKSGDYCYCNSKCDSGDDKTICQAKCEYKEEEQTAEDGSISWHCYCAKQPCSGLPCSLAMNYLVGEIWCPAPKKGFAWYYSEILNSIGKVKILMPNKVDIVKELTYSRNEMQECGIIRSNYGDDAEALSCTRAKDEIISPITEKTTIAGGKQTQGYCYGKRLGQVLKISEPMADNWYCCEKWEKTQ